MSTWQEKARKAMHQRHGCIKTLDEHTSAVNLTSVYYCSRHMFGWLHDVDACAHVDAAVEALAPVVEAEVRRGQAEALREAAAEMERIWVHERRTLGMASDSWLYRRADAIEAGDPR